MTRSTINNLTAKPHNLHAIEPVLRFAGGSTAGLWNATFRHAGEWSMWRACRRPDGWHGWPLDSDDRPLQDQAFATRRELLQVISSLVELKLGSPAAKTARDPAL